MLEVLCFSDLHIHNYKQFDKAGSRLEDCLLVLDTAFKMAHERGITHILFGGDLYDQQKALPAVVVNRTVERFKKLFNKYPYMGFYAITGNHDQSSKSLIDKPAESSLTHLQLMFEGQFILLDNNSASLLGPGKKSRKVYAEVTGIPYYEMPEHFHTRLEEAANYASKVESASILMMHQTPTGYEDMSLPADVDVHDPLFKNFDMVLNGHIHKRRVIGNFITLGNPLHRDLGDVGDEKGFTILRIPEKSGAAIASEFIPLSDFPQFVKREVGTELEPGDEDKYVVWEVPFEKAFDTSADAETQQQFKSDLSAAQLVKNFWEHVDGKDEELLQVGLSFIHN